MPAFIRTLLSLSLFVIVCAFFISFALSNKSIVTVILPWFALSISLPVCALVIAALLLGGLGAALLLWITALPRQRALKRSEKFHRRAAHAQKQEIEALRLEADFGKHHAHPR